MMCTRILFGASAFCLLISGASAAGEVWYVDDNATAHFSTIQAALDAARDGDTIIVRDGYYTGLGNRDIDFKGKAVHLRSENGPKNCIIDAQGSEAEPHRGLFQSGEGRSSILEGLTVIGGFHSHGGGVVCIGSSPAIVGNIFRSNGSNLYGGACLSLDGASPLIAGNTFANNTTRNFGAAICGVASDLVIVSNTIVRNTSTNEGGGLAFYDCSSGTMARNLLVENTACFGGAIFCGRSTADMESLTVVNNTGVYAAGIHCFSSTMSLHNSIVRENNDEDIWLRTGATMTVSYSNFRDDDMFICVYSSSSFIRGYGNFDADPLFANAAKGDYHLKARGGRWSSAAAAWALDEVDSPCIDAGDPLDDLSREPMPNGSRINVGAYGNTPEASKTYKLQMLDVESVPIKGIAVIGGEHGITDYSTDCLAYSTANLSLGQLSPVVVNGHAYNFLYWMIDGVPQQRGCTSVDILMDADRMATAVYNLFADANGDCAVNVLDLIFVRNRLGANPNTGDNWRADIVTGDGAINVLDLIAVRNYLGTRCSE